MFKTSGANKTLSLSSEKIIYQLFDEMVLIADLSRVSNLTLHNSSRLYCYQLNMTLGVRQITKLFNS